MAANLCIIGGFEHHAAARDVASVPHLAYRAFGIERAPLFGFAGQKRSEIGIGKFFGVAGERAKNCMAVSFGWMAELSLPLVRLPKTG